MDGDGEITTEELRLAMNKLMGEHMNRREIDAIVKEADDNGDGTVDFEGANFLYMCSDKYIRLDNNLQQTCTLGKCNQGFFLFFLAEFVRMMSRK